MIAQLTYKAKCVAALTSAAKSSIEAGPDTKDKKGRLLLTAYFWDTVYKYADVQRDQAWADVMKEYFIDKTQLDEGEHDNLVESAHLVVKAVVTKPVKRFDASRMASVITEVFKKPLAIANEIVQRGYAPGARRVTLSVEERK